MSDRVETFLVGVLASVLVSVIYGLILAQREDRIRAKLAATSRGWARRFYVRALVGAVQGKADVNDTSILAYFAIVALYAGSVLALLVPDSINRRLRLVEEWIGESTRALDESAPSESKTDMRNHDLQAEAAELRIDVNRWRLVLQVLSVGGFVATFAGILFWLPFVIVRRGVSHELKRFSLRIQGLASKAELAQMSLAEVRVKNEVTLRTFIQLAAVVAARQGVPELVATFNLWKDSNSVSSENDN